MSSMTVSPHNDEVRRSFRKQVPLFTGPRSPFAARPGAPSPWGPLSADDVVLDVACGAGHVSEQLAPQVRQVVGIDLTPELLELGASRLRDAGIRNVLLQEGDAADLPFVDGSFDVVVCRSSLHHFAHIPRSLREMARVCRVGGRVAIDELVQPPGADAETRDRYDALHRLLDPSHAAAMTGDELVAVCRAQIGEAAEHTVNDPATLPLDLIVTDASDRTGAVQALHGELDGGPPTGFAPVLVDGAIHVRFHTVGIRLDR
jgi:SAM-dependent methyltransferase